MQVKDCALVKPLYCYVDDSVVDIAKALRDNKQRRIIVVDSNDNPLGIVSTSDINNKVVAENKFPSKLRAADIMTSPVYIVCDVNDELNSIFKKMLEHESFFCPVTKDGKLYGVLTYVELVKKVQESLKK